MTVLGITDLWTYVLGTIAIVLLPGPNSLFVLSVAAQRGIRHGYAAACGVFVGDAVLMLAAATGAASLLAAYPALFVFVKWVGAAYLAYIGVQLLRASLQRWLGQQAQTQAMPQDVSQPFRKALVISLLNPKAILFFVSFFIQFVDPHYAYPALSFLLLGTIAQAFSALYLSVLIVSGAKLAQAFSRRRRTASVAVAGVATLFLGFGVKLATASLH